LIISSGAAVGAMSFVKHGIAPFQIWGGNPLRYISPRLKGMIELSGQLDEDGL
jgi:acetyltransferase-like isoleucine patch superfamily enzyme